MKVYADYNGEVPAGVVVVKEGPITRIYFDYEHITKTIDGETIEQLVCENVDITGAIEYDAIVAAIVRDKYSQDRVEAILANGSDTPEHAAELEAFQTWRAKAKTVAHAVIEEVFGSEEEE